MKLLLLALFATVGCSFATYLPIAPCQCGDSFIQVANAIRPSLNNAGQIGVNNLIEGIRQLNLLIGIGDIAGISRNFENIGAVGLRNLATATSDPYLQQTLLSLAEIDSFVANLLLRTTDPNKAAEFACNTLTYKAQRINSCIASSAYAVLI